MQEISKNKVFNGWHKQFEHDAESVSCKMRFAVYLPPQVEYGQKVPVLYWLSGLTCTDENFMQKAGAFRVAAELGLAIVAPDTSPRGEGVPDDADGDYDLGLGAGFYLNATQEPWHKHYRMYDYVVNELPELIAAHFPVTQQKAISGHSMGGHGALIIALKNPNTYSSVSAFSPICNPVDCAWGQKVFSNYLCNDKRRWQQYDACELLLAMDEPPHLPMLVDQGDADNFLEDQLKPQALISAAASINFPITLRMQAGYDHSYYFISSFIEDHLRFHVEHLSTSANPET